MRLLDKPLANRKMSSNPEAIPVNQPSSIVNPRLKVHLSVLYLNMCADYVSISM